MIKEFKEFISKGNVTDLAIAVVLGAAFTAIVNSLVNDIIMPIIGLIIGGKSFENLSITVGDAVIKYGMFIQSIINYILISLVVFMIIKSLNKFKKKKEEEPEKPSEEVMLLTEIRDLLKK